MAENNTFQAATYTARGTQREAVTLPETLFDGTVNVPVMHQAVKAYLANQRQGNASTKVRKYVTGGNQKPWKQKGTGRARQGSTRAPHWVGGGTVFGPLPRSYAQYVPRQVRALARKSAFNARARENAIFVIDNFTFDAPKTRQMVDLIERLDMVARKVLVLTDGVKTNVFLSARNIPNVHVMPYGDVSTYHILWSDVVLIESGALGEALAPVAEKEHAPRSASRAGKPAKKPAKAESEAAPRKPAAKHAPSTGEGKAAPTKAAKAAAARKPAAKKATAKHAPSKREGKTASKPTRKKGK